MRKSYTELEDMVRGLIKPKRFTHSLGVAAVSVALARRFALSVDDARYIGIYHDAYRYACTEESPAFCRKHGVEVFPEEEGNVMLLHGALAAVHFPWDAGDVPEYFQRAVRHHTLGHVEMGVYGAVLYIADYTEPGRKHLDDKEREYIFSSDTLEEMIIKIMDAQRAYFESNGTIEAGVSVELYKALKDGLRFGI